MVRLFEEMELKSSRGKRNLWTCYPVDRRLRSQGIVPHLYGFLTRRAGCYSANGVADWRGAGVSANGVAAPQRGDVITAVNYLVLDRFSRFDDAALSPNASFRFWSSRGT
jgi:hypothetical protein